MYSLQLLSKFLRIETMILRQILQNVEWRIRVLKYQRTYLLHPVLGQFSWNMQDKYLLIMYAILVHLLSFYLFIYAFILFLHRNYCKIIELTLVIELILVIKLTFECFFIHWTHEVFNIFHERTLIWWLRSSLFVFY